MNNRGYNSYNRHRPKKRITGRFYAFLTVLVVLVVMFSVVLSNRSGSRVVNQPQIVPTPAPVAEATVDPAGSADASQAPSDGGEATGEAGTESIDALLEANPDLAPLEGDQKVQVNDLSVTEGLPSEWHNILLLGSDTRNIKKVARTDTIIIASINTNDGRIKLISIMRDTIVPIPGHGDRKINSASYYGGPTLTMKVINECFKLNITEYVLVNFGSFKEIVDILGGVRLDITKKEMEQINGSLAEQGRLLGLDKEKWQAGEYDLKTYGDDTELNGLHALAYARIRHIDSDYQRTERQRLVIDAAIKKFRNSVSVKQLMQLATSMWGYVDTNVEMFSAVGLATTVLKSGIGKITTGLMPITNSYKSETRKANGAALYDVDFQTNAARLYKFIYEE